MAAGEGQSPDLRSIADRVRIAPGVLMPRLGLGTSQALGGDVQREVLFGLSIGYRLIDTAAMYGNEREIGAALRRTDVPREDVFVTTKVWNSDQGYERTLAAFSRSRARLGLEYVDLYLVHWPQPGLTGETWRALEELLASGETRAIGVSNFGPSHFRELSATANVPPAVDQFEFHPGMQRPDVVRYCRENAVTMQAWSPLMRGGAGREPVLREIGERHGKSPAQVALRWILQQGLTTIPKSVHEDRIAQNADVFDFQLGAEEMARIDGMDRDSTTRPFQAAVMRRLAPLTRMVKPPE